MFTRSRSAVLSSRNRLSTIVQKKLASVLVVAEHDGKQVSAGTLSAVTAASKIGDVSLLVSGKGVGEVAQHAAKVKNVSKVLVADHEALSHHLPEDVTAVLKEVVSKNNFSHVLAPSSSSSKSYLPRLAALMDISPVTDVIAIVDESTFKRPIYAGNAIATVQSTTPLKIVSIRTTAFEKAEVGNESKEIVSTELNVSKSPLSSFVSATVVKSDRPDLSTARVVVSGGRGLKSGENFKILEKLADKLGGAVGASRAAVDAGFVPNEYQVGQTGKVVAPDLYIAVGISGAIQHLSGMKDSKTIVAINKDKEAPIFQVADYGLVEDLFKAVPELEAKL